MNKSKNESSFKKPLHLNALFEIKLKRKFYREGNWIKMEVAFKSKWKLLKIKNGSSIKKPLYLNDLFGNQINKRNWIEKEIE